MVRRPTLEQVLPLFILALLFSCGGGSSHDADSVITRDPFCDITMPATEPDTEDFGLSERQSPECVNLSANTELASEIRVTNAYPSLSFDRPVDVVQVPGTDNVVVVEHGGIVHIFENHPDTSSSSVFLDLTSVAKFDGNEQGVVKLTFDPNYEINGYFYVSYAGLASTSPDECDPHCSVIARFSISDNPLVADLSSEEYVMIIHQNSPVHNADNLVFDADNYLYIGVGDGGWDGQPGDPQNRSNILGSILRIDVSEGLPYRIPNDNPFTNETLEQEGVVGEGQVIKHEIWAFGLRNPHRFSIDPETGEMIAGDVGQVEREELDIIRAGANYGWDIFEGSSQYTSDLGTRALSELSPPLLEYDHSVGQSITAGYVYRGTQFPSLFGSYIYGDFSAGTIWALDKDDDNNVTSNVEIANAGGFSLASFGLVDNEIVFTNLAQGSIQRLEHPDGSGPPVPNKLSATGMFLYFDPLTPSPGVIPYGVNSALWSDGTVKSRWMIIPDDLQVTFDSNLAWEFPLGAVLVKHFAIDTDQTNNILPLLNLETRVLINTNLGWLGYTYQWDEDQQDATLLHTSARKNITITSAQGSEILDYYFPSIADCTICHNATEGFVLGVRAAQLNGNYHYDAFSSAQFVTDNQLRALNHIGIFDTELADANEYSHRYAAIDDTSASVELRARSYLASNCAHCHNPDNALPTPLDFRYRENASELNAINLDPLNNLGITDTKVIRPGEKEKSVLWLRMQALDDSRMPPLATYKVDEDALALIGLWIDGL